MDYTSEEIEQLAREFEKTYGMPYQLTKESLTDRGGPPTLEQMQEAVATERELGTQTAYDRMFSRGGKERA